MISPRQPSSRSPRALVVGCGLIGGSIAGALCANGVRVTGCDRASVLGKPRGRQLFARTCTPRQLRAQLRTERWDVVVLAMPLPAIIATLPKISVELAALPVARRPLVIDTASVKGPVVAAAEACGCPEFVGGHPMAGRERGGLDHAESALLHGRAFVLCPASTASARARARARRFVKQVGARPIVLTTVEHDRAVALVSHLPHVIALSLMETSRRRSTDMNALPWSLAAGAWRDATRVAAADARLWDTIFAHNRGAIRDVLREWRAVLKQMEAGLGAPDSRRIDAARLARLRRKLAAKLPT